MKKKFFVFLIVFLITIINSEFVFSEKIKSYSPNFIMRVGIKYNLDNSNFYINSDYGYKLMLNSNRIEVELFDIENRDINLYFQKGKYHARISERYPTYLGALEKYQELRKVGNVFLAYNDAWFVAYGSYDTKEKLSNDFLNIKKKFSLQNVYEFYNSTVIDIVDDRIVFSYDSKDAEFFVKPIKGNLDSSKYKYRGGIGVKLINGKFSIINYVNMREYLYGVLPYEMSTNWPIEALKAQAVAARNFAFSNINKYAKYGFDLSDGTSSQVYKGVKGESELTNLAVDLTKGEVLLYNDSLVEAYFHSNSGGHTESSENIWSEKIPYIVGVDDKYSERAPNAFWDISFTKKEIEAILSKNKIYIGNLKDIKIANRSENGRVLDLMFIGTLTNASFKKEKIRAIFGYSVFKSIWYDVKKDTDVTVMTSKEYSSVSLKNSVVLTSNGKKNLGEKSYYIASNGVKKVKLNTLANVFTFEGKGYGHGLGMSQWGARIMAEEGKDYKEILAHYYTGTTLIKSD